MSGAELFAALKGGKRVYGTLVTSTSPLWPEAVRKTGVDFVFIDTEHIPIGRSECSSVCQVYKAIGLAPIVRIPAPDPYQACIALDGGAVGVIAPYIETVEQVKALRAAVKLRPLKGQRAQRILNGAEECEQELADYLARRNADSILMLNIESRPALDALDAILKVPQIDAIIIGPHDLSCSLGIPEQYHHPAFDSAVRQIIRKARDAGLAVGVHYWGIDQIVQWARDGLNVIIYSSDIRSFAESISTDLQTIKDALGEGR